MAVNIQFLWKGQYLTESNSLDFGTVQAGTSSGIQTISVSNTGNSDAMNCIIEAKEATVVNGFSSDTQLGTPQETYLAQQFAQNETSTWYSYSVVGTSKNWMAKAGGTLANTSGSDSFVTKWTPPAQGTSGTKVWGNVFTCVYV